MTDNRKNLKITPDAYEQLDEKKPADQSWSEYLVGLLEGSRVAYDVRAIPNEQLTEIAHRVGDEIEDRLRSR